MSDIDREIEKFLSLPYEEYKHLKIDLDIEDHINAGGLKLLGVGRTFKELLNSVDGKVLLLSPHLKESTQCVILDFLSFGFAAPSRDEIESKLKMQQIPSGASALTFKEAASMIETDGAGYELIFVDSSEYDITESFYDLLNRAEERRIKVITTFDIPPTVDEALEESDETDDLIWAEEELRRVNEEIEAMSENTATNESIKVDTHLATEALRDILHAEPPKVIRVVDKALEKVINFFVRKK